jgi:hypothetical protein
MSTRAPSVGSIVPPPPPGSLDDGPAGPASGFGPALIGFVSGWLVGYTLVRIVAAILLSSTDVDGLSGFALALSVGGLMRIGITGLALIGCYGALRLRRAPSAGLTVVLTLATWWLVSALPQFIGVSGFRVWWLGTLAALFVAPLAGRAIAVGLAGRVRFRVALGLAIGALALSSLASDAIGRAASDRAVERFLDQLLAGRQIDFTPYMPTDVPLETTATDDSVLGPVTPPAILRLSYGRAPTGAAGGGLIEVAEFRRTWTVACPTPPPTPTPGNHRLSCDEVGVLDSGEPVLRAEGADVWTERGDTVIVLTCNLRPTDDPRAEPIGCVNGGELDRRAARVLNSMVEAVFTPAGPDSGTGASLVPADR